MGTIQDFFSTIRHMVLNNILIERELAEAREREMELQRAREEEEKLEKARKTQVSPEALKQAEELMQSANVSVINGVHYNDGNIFCE